MTEKKPHRKADKGGQWTWGGRRPGSGRKRHQRLTSADAEQLAEIISEAGRDDLVAKLLVIQQQEKRREARQEAKNHEST